MTGHKGMAMAWLEEARTPGASNIDAQYRDVIKAMLAQPRLPDELSPELIEAIWQAACHRGTHRDFAHNIMKAIRDWVTRPRTKTAYVVTASDIPGAPCDWDSTVLLVQHFLEKGHEVRISNVQVPA